MAMLGKPDFVPLTANLKVIIRNWKYTIGYMSKNPTDIRQLVIDTPYYIGYSDSCKLGAGGCWAAGIKPLQPFLWWVEWPADIQQNLITVDNPDGNITINDLELARMLLNLLVLEYTNLDIAHTHLALFCNNTSAVAWSYKLRTSKSTIAGRLLQMLGLQIHSRKASSLTPFHIAGEDNQMADIISRSFKLGQDLTHYFDTHFPLPQNKSWTELKILTKVISLVTCSLHGKLVQLESLLKLQTPGKSIGHTGASTQKSVEWTHSSPTHPHLNGASLLQHNGCQKRQCGI